MVDVSIEGDFIVYKDIERDIENIFVKWIVDVNIGLDIMVDEDIGDLEVNFINCG